MTLHEQTTDDLKQQVAEGSLSPKKEARAEAVLRHGRSERIRDWLGRHAWMGAWSRCWIWHVFCCHHETNDAALVYAPPG
jgi:hypothetical protein